MQSTIRNRITHTLSLTGRRLRAIAALAIAALATAACDVHGVSEPGTLASIVVTPNATLTATSTQQMTAIGYDADGRTVTISPTWSIAASGGSVNAAGLFTAGSVTGLFSNTVVASVGTISGRASITVTAGALATITVVPNPVTLAVTASQQFIAIGKDIAGNIVSLAPSWTVVAGGGTISQTGVFTAGAAVGTYVNTVQVSDGGIKAFATVNVTVGPLATITVTPNPATMIVGTTQQFTAVGKDASGNAVAIAAAWTVVAAGGAIDGGGLFTAGATPGTYTNTVKATSGTLSGTATVTVTVGPLATITVTPNPATMAVNTTQQFTAVGRDAGGNVVVIAPVWDIATTPNGATITQAGLYNSGTLTGTFTNKVRATSGTIAGLATVIVTAGPLASITVTPNPVFMPTNSTQQFVAVGRDASNNVFVISPVWSVVNGGGGISSTGLFAAGSSTGTFLNTIQAAVGTINGTATVTVTLVPVLTTITVSPNPGTMATNATQQFTAVGRDQVGNVFTFVPTWSVVNGGGAINGATGLFTAGAVAGTFNNTVQAASGAVTGLATATVTAPPPLASAFLGLAAPFGILAGSGITCAVSGTVNGSATDLGSNPNIVYTGFSPAPAVCTYTGTIQAPPVVSAAKGALTTAFNAEMAKPCDLNIAGSDLGFYDGSTPAKTLGPGTYCFPSTTAGLTGTMKLTGSATDVWTFQVGTALTTAVASNLILAGVLPDNVHWAIGSSATLGTSSNFQGNIMAGISITLNANSVLIGRALAQVGAVDMTAGGATITKP